MTITSKAKSAIYHLNTALSGSEKAQVHLIQARTSLPKGDDASRQAVADANEGLVEFTRRVNDAQRIIEINNPSKSDKEN